MSAPADTVAADLSRSHAPVAPRSNATEHSPFCPDGSRTHLLTGGKVTYLGLRRYVTRCYAEFLLHVGCRCVQVQLHT